MKPRFDDPAAREEVRRRLAGLGERSSRKSYYPELQESVEELHRFRALLDGGSEAILLAELPGGTLVDVNGSACRQLGREREALIGAPLPSLFAAFERERVAEAIARRSPAGAAHTLSVRLARPDGSSFPAEVTLGERSVDGRPYLVVVARDVSEREILQTRLALADRMIALGMLAAGVAHEVNNPLTYVLANLDHVARGLAELRSELSAAQPPGQGAREPLARAVDDLAEAVAEAYDGAGRVRAIAQDLKAFSRGESSPAQPLDVRQVLETALTLSEHQLEPRARVLRSLGEVPPVLAHEGRLVQVLVNLLVNAAQAIPEGDVARNEVRVATRTAGGRVVIEVADTGTGIAPDDLGRIFQPFFTTKPHGVGTGLGLAICREIVRALGGEIEVESEPGRGATFRVLLAPAPASRADAP